MVEGLTGDGETWLSTSQYLTAKSLRGQFGSGACDLDQSDEYASFQSSSAASGMISEHAIIFHRRRQKVADLRHSAESAFKMRHVTPHSDGASEAII